MKINVTVPVNSLGYGIVGLNVLLALEAAGHEVAWWALGQVEAPAEHGEVLRRCADRQANYSSVAPSLRIYHQFDLAQHVGGGAHCALPIFELNRFKPVEQHHLRQQDRLFVASQWAKRTLLDVTGVTKSCIHVAPLGVDASIFHPSEETEQTNGPTRFLSCGKWEIRKGHDVLADAFCKAFTVRDNVRLEMNCFNPCFQDREKLVAYNESWERLYKSSALREKITVRWNRLRTQHDVAALMVSADCGVFPARAEGWNLDLAEMLAMGKHVIATDYAAHTEFCTSENARLISIDEVEDAHDGVWFNAADAAWNGRPGQWARLGEPQVDQLVEHMRAIHRLKQDGQLKPNVAGVETMKKFTWQNTAATIVEALGG